MARAVVSLQRTDHLHVLFEARRLEDFLPMRDRMTVLLLYRREVRLGSLHFLDHVVMVAIIFMATSTHSPARFAGRWSTARCLNHR